MDRGLINENIDLKADIIPAKKLANIELRTHIRNYKKLLTSVCMSGKMGEALKYKCYGFFHIGYEIQDSIILVFHVMNGKLMKIIAKNNYLGSYNGIKIGTKIKDIENEIDNFYYDEGYEYYYIEGLNGIIFEPDAFCDYIEKIVIYIEELDIYENDFIKKEELELGLW